MTDIIVYIQKNGEVAMIGPAPDTELTVVEIGEKDVPLGINFWIVPLSEAVEKNAVEALWEMDTDSMGKPAGTGTYKSVIS